MKKYIKDIAFLPESDPSAIPYHESMQYPSYIHYEDTLSNYHFDKWQDDTKHEGISNNSLRFTGRCLENIMQEVLPYNREVSQTAYVNDRRYAHNSYWYHTMDIPNYNNHVGYRETLKPEKHPTLEKIVNWFEFESHVQARIAEKKPGDWEIWHVDSFSAHPNGRGKGKVIRILVHLQDWEFGQFLQWGTKPIIQWRQGDVLTYDPNIPHASGNSSRYTRYTLIITATPSDTTLYKINQGGTINLDHE